MTRPKKETETLKKLHNLKLQGGGNGTRGGSTNEEATETKGDKKRTRGVSTNDQVKQYYHDQNPRNKKNKA